MINSKYKAIISYIIIPVLFKKKRKKNYLKINIIKILQFLNYFVI